MDPFATPAAPQAEKAPVKNVNEDAAFKGMEFIDLSLGKAPKPKQAEHKSVYINNMSFNSAIPG